MLDTRAAIRDLLHGRDTHRLLVVVGPCSVHDPSAALEYAHKLKRVADDLADHLLIVMRTYFEKPRTTIGWKGLINDPRLDGSCDIPAGLELARSILLEWAGHVSEGMLPNRFPDQGDTPEYNTVDASLWYIVAVHDYLRALERRGRRVPQRERRALADAVQAILAGHVRGTRYGIRATEDGLLASGEPGVQLTWMDAKVGDWVVTPRTGKAVEIQALWLNALRVAEEFTAAYRSVWERGSRTFAERLWNAEAGGLYDVVDVDHVDGRMDPAVRPNQIFAVGGLPWPLLDGARARQVVDLVEARLWTPLGLRTLAPGSEGYRPRYEGGVALRPAACANRGSVTWE